MKKIAITTILLLFLIFSFFVGVAAKANELEVDDLTTLTFPDRADEFDFHSIKKLCSYDYCDYMYGDTLNEGLENFTKNYLRTIKDEETRSILQVKGIRITKIIFMN